MKKLTALLLAFLMPIWAAAETYGFSISAETDEALLLNYAEPSLSLLPESAVAEAEMLVKLFARVMNGFGVEVAVQADAAELRLSLSGEEALQLLLHQSDGELLLSSPMLKGYAIKTKMPQLQQTALTDAFAAYATGVFVGDAYEGGTQCTTWALSGDGLTSLLPEAYIHMLDQVMSSLNGELSDVSADDLIIRVVQDDEDQVVGISVTFMREQMQLATLSIGFQEEKIILVAGLGLSAQNYWCRMTCKQSQVDELVYLNGNVQEWLVDKAESFSSVSTLYAPQAAYQLRATVTETSQSCLWSGTFCTEDGRETLATFAGNIAPERGMMNAALGLGGSSNKKPLTLRIACQPTEALAPFDATLAICSAEDTAMFDSLVKQFTAAAAARMIKLLPMDLILQMTQYVSMP